MISFSLSNSDGLDVPINSGDLVLHEMKLIEQDQDGRLAEEVLVYAKEDGEEKARIALCLLRKISCSGIGWSVWLNSISPTQTLALFERAPVGAKYCECLECGCPQFIRWESIIHDKSLIVTAIAGFLKLQLPDPSLLWLPAGESHYLAPRSEWKRPECVTDDEQS